MKEKIFPFIIVVAFFLAFCGTWRDVFLFSVIIVGITICCVAFVWALTKLKKDE